MQTLLSFIVGLIFSLGLLLSGLINPGKVLNFLDVAGTWDPSLALTMGAAVITTAIGFRFALQRQKPVFGDVFHLPTSSDIDGKLLTGAGLFGIGWGLIGYCPGPALAASSSGRPETLIFIAAMLVGMIGAHGAAKLALKLSASRAT